MLREPESHRFAGSCIGSLRSLSAIRTTNIGWCTERATKTAFITEMNSSTIAEAHPNFHYLPTLSRGLDTWQGLRGYVQDHVREIVGQRRDMHAYICGLHQMVDANRLLLKEELGWDRKQIVFERYD